MGLLDFLFGSSSSGFNTQEEVNAEIIRRCNKAGIQVMQRGNQFGTHAGSMDKLNKIIRDVRGY